MWTLTFVWHICCIFAGMRRMLNVALPLLSAPVLSGCGKDVIAGKVRELDEYIRSIAPAGALAVTFAVAFIIIGMVFYLIVRHYSKLLQKKESEMQSLIDTLNNVTGTLATQTARTAAAESEASRVTDVLIDEDVFVEALRRSPHYLSDEEWEQLINKIDKVYDGYSAQLLQENPTLTPNNVRLSCLVKLRFSNPQIALILGISPSSVIKAKQRLKQRLAD